MTVRRLLEQLQETIEFVHDSGFTESFRLGQGRTKKLRDEVVPVARFLRAVSEPQDRIQFSLDNAFPDCVLTRSDGEVRQIEVTVAQAKTRFFTMSELNRRGTGRGYMNLTDEESSGAFENQMAQPRMAYETREIVETASKAIKICIEKKKHHGSDTLVVELLSVEILPKNRWSQHLDQLRSSAHESSFNEVYMTCSSTDGDVCLRLK